MSRLEQVSSCAARRRRAQFWSSTSSSVSSSIVSTGSRFFRKAERRRPAEVLSLTAYSTCTTPARAPTSASLRPQNPAKATSPLSGWGSLLVSENIIKEVASASSPVLGRSTGSGLLSIKGGFVDGGVQVLNKFWFSPTSKYNGSSITVLGTLRYPLPPWELTAIAGTGLFRGHCGYVLASPTTLAPLYVYKFTFHLYWMW